MALLRDEVDAEDKLVQRDISDDDLQRVLDRSDLTAPVADEGRKHSVNEEVSSFPLRGPGWEVVLPAKTGGGLLSAVNS